MYVEYLSYVGLTPVCVQQGPEALRVARRADVIVTDVLVPGPMDGFELIRRLRNDPATARLPIVVLTVCAWIEDKKRALNAGCDVFLPKPCYPDALVRVLHRVTGNHPTHARGTVCAGAGATCRGGKPAVAREQQRPHRSPVRETGTDPPAPSPSPHGSE